MAELLTTSIVRDKEDLTYEGMLVEPLILERFVAMTMMLRPHEEFVVRHGIATIIAERWPLAIRVSIEFTDNEFEPVSFWIPTEGQVQSSLKRMIHGALVRHILLPVTEDLANDTE